MTIPKPSETKGRVIREGTPKEAGMASNVSEKLDAVLNEWAANTDTPFIACVARHGVVEKTEGQVSRRKISTLVFM